MPVILRERFVNSAVRRWAAMYTMGLPTTVRSQRIAEIESDLYEQRREADASAQPFLPSALSRLVRGMPQDLFWSLDVRLVNGGIVSMGTWSARTKEERAISFAFVGVALFLIVTAMGGLWVGAPAAALGLLIFAVVRGRRLAAEEQSMKGEAPHMPEITRYRGPLIAFAISAAIFAGTAAYAFSLDHWGNWALVFNLVGPASLFVALGSLAVLVARLLRDRSQDR